MRGVEQQRKTNACIASSYPSYTLRSTRQTYAASNFPSLWASREVCLRACFCRYTETHHSRRGILLIGRPAKWTKLSRKHSSYLKNQAKYANFKIVLVTYIVKVNIGGGVDFKEVLEVESDKRVEVQALLKFLNRFTTIKECEHINYYLLHIIFKVCLSTNMTGRIITNEIIMASCEPRFIMMRVEE